MAPIRWLSSLAVATLAGASCAPRVSADMSELDAALTRLGAGLSAQTRARFLVIDLREVMPWNAPELMDLGMELCVRGECPGASPLRRWFEAKGITHSFEMLEVVRTALWRRIRGRSEDLAGLVEAARLECRRRFGPVVALPVIPEYRFGFADGPGAFNRVHRITVDVSGQWTVTGQGFEGLSLREALRLSAEVEADLVLRCDRDAPWKVVKPIVRAISEQARPDPGFALAVLGGDSDHEEYLFCHSGSGPEALPPIEFRLGSSAGAEFGTADLTRIPELTDASRLPARVILDDSVRMGDLAPLVHELNCRLIWHMEFVDAPL